MIKRIMELQPHELIVNVQLRQIPSEMGKRCKGYRGGCADAGELVYLIYTLPGDEPYSLVEYGGIVGWVKTLWLKES